MNKLPNISIIIPIYNAAPYLNQCLESIKNQSFTDFEVIMVNDGSTDTSKEICMSFVEKDRRYKLIDQKNSGVSSARNTGIDISQGEWITFIDSDDWIDCDYLQNTNSLIGLEQADAICNLNICINNDSYMKFDKPVDTDTNDILSDLINGKLPTSMWCYFFRKESISNMIVDAEIHHYEDLDFLIRYFINGKLILFNNESRSLYHYRQGSITHQKITQKTISGFKVIDKCMQIGLDALLLNSLCSKMLISITLIAARDRNYKNEYDDIIKNRAREYRKSAYYNCASLKSRFIIWLLSISPNLYYRLYKIAH